jgi:hypothetical protein
MKPDCRRAKKAAWKREKMRTDPQFRLDCQLSNQKWLKENPGDWKAYRDQHPDKVERNRQLQAIRNRRRARKPKDDRYLDTGKIAKVDAINVRVFEITAPYQ